ncbi:efflux RND transporter permease subunit [Bacteroides sp.]|jgi:nolG efflux transporter|uniref:efflux RND transporter permease subunit n=1 Tax=Bacteroides sp. TaxID=29523 RepID=UPI00260F55BE|nr:efflux RND transporter permease subunit [Bacteroides sp.]MDD3038037.1 efflux RND transporter permease subunit [Bacteroides sp.]
MKIVKISITRPVVVIVASILLTFFGLFSYSTLSQELFPRVAMQTIMIGTPYPGASPQEVENSVTKKIEDAISSLEGIKDIKSVSMESFSMSIIRLKYGIDTDRVMQDAQRKINAIRGDLPGNVKESSIDKYDYAELPILNVSAVADIPDLKFYDFVKHTIKPSIESVTGVAKVELFGGNEREIQINLSEDKLRLYSLSILQITQTLINSNIDFPTGKVENDEKQILVRLEGKYQSVSDIENVVLKVTANGGVVKIRDVADVFDTQKKTTTINRANGINSIGISIRRQTDANAVLISKEVENILSALERQYSLENLKFHIALNDSEFTIEAVNSVILDLIMAVIFVAITMLLFFHSFRNSLIVLISIPISLVSTFIVMYVFGITINLATLLALSLIIGILIDDAVVVVENVHRHLEMGKNRIQATYDAIKELGLTLLSTTLVLVVVFIPIALTQSAVSDLFRGFCYTAAAAVLFSTLASFTLVPFLSSRIGKLEKINKQTFIGRFINWFEEGIQKLAIKIRKLLAWSFNHKIVVFVCTFLLFICSLMLVPLGFIGTEFASIGDRGEFYLDIEMPKNSTIEQTNLLTHKAEAIIDKNPHVTSIFTTVGAEEDGLVQPYLSEILVKISPNDKRNLSTEECAREIKKTLQEQLVGAKIMIAQSAITGGKDVDPIEMYVTGNNVDTILVVAEAIKNRISQIPGVIDAKLSLEVGTPEINIKPDREKMTRLGIPFELLGASLNNAFSGNQDAKFRDGNNEYDINIQLDKFDRKDIQDVKNFSLINMFGNTIYLHQFAEISEAESPSKIERRNRIPSVRVISQIAGRSVGVIGEDIIKEINTLKMPSSVSVAYGGEMEIQDEGFETIGWAFIISIVLVYLIMVLLYNDYIYPFAVLFSLPLALMGALTAIALAMENISIFTLLGMIMLIGLVAKNSILVVDFANQLQNQGMNVKEALLEATQRRFRPIIMTVLSTIVGMLPIALAQGAGADWKNGLAWVLIGGLTSSTFLSLLIVPLVYYLLNRVMFKFGIKRKIIDLKD